MTFDFPSTVDVGDSVKIGQSRIVEAIHTCLVVVIEIVREIQACAQIAEILSSQCHWLLRVVSTGV